MNHQTEGNMSERTPPPTDYGWITVKQASAYLQMHPNFIRKALNEGRLVGIRHSSISRWRTTIENCNAFMAAKVPDDEVAISDVQELARQYQKARRV